jgi:hypothetical protein
VCRSLKFQAPGVFVTCAPSRVRACQSRNPAPAGSVQVAVRPPGPASEGAEMTVPPAAVTAAAVALASSTATYVFHAAGAAGRHRDRPDVLPVEGGDEIGPRRAGRRRVGQRPTEQPAVEPARGLRVGLLGVDPARHAVRVGSWLGHLWSLSSAY